MLHDDRIETIVHPGLLLDKDDVIIPRSTGLIDGVFFNTPRHKIAPANFLIIIWFQISLAVVLVSLF